MTPVEFSEEEMTTLRKKHASKTACFWINNCPVLQTNWYDEEREKFCLSWPNKTLKYPADCEILPFYLRRERLWHIQMILPLSALFYRMWRWMIQIHKKCQASQSVLPRPWPDITGPTPFQPFCEPAFLVPHYPRPPCAPSFIKSRTLRILPREIRELNTLSKIKTHIFKHFMDQDRINHVCTVN